MAYAQVATLDREGEPLSMTNTAFLQYTSGSTGNQKVVIVSHANLLHNLSGVHQFFINDSKDAHLVTW